MHGRFTRSENAHTARRLETKRLSETKAAPASARFAARRGGKDVDGIAELFGRTSRAIYGHVPVANNLVVAILQSRIAWFRRLGGAALEMLERVADRILHTGVLEMSRASAYVVGSPTVGPEPITAGSSGIGP